MREGFGAGGEEFVGGAEAPECAEGKHAGGDGGLHVGGGVADVEEFGGGNGHGLGDVESGLGIGLVREAGGGAHDDLEVMAGEDFLDALDRERMGFVGEDGEPESLGGGGVEEFGDAGVGTGLGVPDSRVLGVIGFHALVEDGLGAGVRREGAEQEVLDAVADEVAVGIDGMCGITECGEGEIAGVGDIGEGVDEGAVEVEKDGLKAHGGSSPESSGEGGQEGGEEAVESDADGGEGGVSVAVRGDLGCCGATAGGACGEADGVTVGDSHGFEDRLEGDGGDDTANDGEGGGERGLAADLGGDGHGDGGSDGLWEHGHGEAFVAAEESDESDAAEHGGDRTGAKRQGDTPEAAVDVAEVFGQGESEGHGCGCEEEGEEPGVAEVFGVWGSGGEKDQDHQYDSDEERVGQWMIAEELADAERGEVAGDGDADPEGGLQERVGELLNVIHGFFSHPFRGDEGA